jgi:peptidoglycan hydrolase-like protein with peptidoglycan-binding domain
MAITKIGGTSRYDTAVKVSQAGWPSADTVVLAAEGLGDAAGETIDTTVHMDFQWPVPMSVGEADSDSSSYRNLEPRCSTNETSAIRQLQRRLKDLGYSFAARNFNWSKHYANETFTEINPAGGTVPPSAAFDYVNSRAPGSIGRNSGDWYVMVRYYVDGPNANRSVGTQDAYSSHEAQLQQRLDEYPGGLDEMWLGSDDGVSRQFDGRLGKKTPEAIRLFQSLAGITDNLSNGYWVDTATKNALELGLNVNGVYDVATRVAVWLFQENHRRAGNTFNLGTANGIVDTKTMNALEYDVPGTTTLPGQKRDGAPDMLCAIPLAAKNNAPLFGVPKDSLPSAIRSEIQRLGASKAIIVGGTGSIDSGVQSTLSSMGLSVRRINGADRFEVSANVAAEFPSGRDCLVVNGYDYLMTLGIGAYASKNQVPILLSDYTNVSSAVSSQISRFNQKIFVGIDKLISESVKNRFSNTRRISSPDRHRMAVEFTKAVKMNTDNGVYMSSDGAWTDNYSGAVLAGKRDCPMIPFHLGYRYPYADALFMYTRDTRDITIVGFTSDSTLESLMNSTVSSGVNLGHYRMILQPQEGQ